MFLVNKYCLFLLSFIFFSCEEYERQSEYPDDVIKYSLQEEYDIAKWDMYSKYYKCKAICEGNLYDTTSSLVSKDLVMNKMKIYGDTIEMYFYFPCNNGKGYYRPETCDLYYTVGFLKGSKIIYYWEIGPSIVYNNEFIIGQSKAFLNNIGVTVSEDTLKEYISREKNRQNKFNEYLNNNKSILNTWLIQKISSDEFPGVSK